MEMLNKHYFARQTYEILAEVLLKIQDFWDITRCLLVGRFGRWVMTSSLVSLLGLHDPKRQDTRIPRNIGNCLQVNTA